jgi:hypothetical protein
VKTILLHINAAMLVVLVFAAYKLHQLGLPAVCQ